MRFDECPECGKSFRFNSQSIYFAMERNGKKVYLCGYNCTNSRKKKIGIKEYRKGMGR